MESCVVWPMREEEIFSLSWLVFVEPSRLSWERSRMTKNGWSLDRSPYGPDCWLMSAPLCTRTGMTSVCPFTTATTRAGRSSAPWHTGSALWHDITMLTRHLAASQSWQMWCWGRFVCGIKMASWKGIKMLNQWYFTSSSSCWTTEICPFPSWPTSFRSWLSLVGWEK